MYCLETLSDLLRVVAERYGNREALLSIQRHGRTDSLSAREFIDAVCRTAKALESRGVARGDRVALFATNRPEWHIVDFACHLLGAVSVPIYPTLNAPQVAYILLDSGAGWIFYDDQAKRDLLSGIVPNGGGEDDRRGEEDGGGEDDGRGEDDEGGDEQRGPRMGDEQQGLRMVALDAEAEAPGGTHLDALIASAPPATDADLAAFGGRVGRDDTASIIYTSGTTGDPKGVVLSHWNFVSNILACQELYPLGEEDQALSFLPLSHVFERTVDYLFFYRGVSIHYSPAIERVAGLMPEVRPTVLCSVPRLYESAYVRINGQFEKQPPARRRLIAWALKVGRRRAERGGAALQGLIADRLVFRKIKQRFGGRLRFAISGGAAIADEVAEFFDAIGIRLYQGYGLTETAPVLAVEYPGASRRGSVGPAAPGVELRIADDGEILARTEGLMRGYWKKPQDTAEAIDADGWFHTGDIGRLDDDGYLYITDRKKDLLVTSGGKNIAPQPIEQMLIAHPAVAQVVVVGDGYPYLNVLIVPNYAEPPAPFADMDPSALREDSRFQETVQGLIDRANERLPVHERLRRFRLLERELTIEEGEITPTLKVRRKIVNERYRDVIASMYLRSQRVS